jgi:hypothetical protein
VTVRLVSWLLIALAGVGLVGLVVLNESRVVLEAQPARREVLDLFGAGVYAQGVRAEAPGLTQIDFTITYPPPAPQPAPSPRLRFRLRELPDGPDRVNVLLTPLIPGRHGYVTVRFPPLPAAAGPGYEFSLEREDPGREPSLQIWGSERDAYPRGVYRRNGVPVPDSDMTFLASFRMRGSAALGVLARRVTARRPAPWSWSGSYVALVLVYGGALAALLAGLARMPADESPEPR